MNEQQLLMSGAKALDITLSEAQQSALLRYHALLVKWNKAYNLTAVRDPMEMVSRHLVDSLSVLPFIDRKTVLDVGSGGGMPGVMIAICQPDTQVVSLDSNGKKTRFLQQVKIDLQLDNFSVEHTRLEQYEPEQKFDMITCRAFASLRDMVNWSQQALADTGVWVAMKGVYPHDEIADLPAWAKVSKVTEIDVPQSDGERHIVHITR
ncbi:16S rRNA (guanine(527)-N(7))-methyltransferase RsmG [Salinibius halmophilus]|uniref:16S rRNA (guanine(527)-N(7))-methyltransferase RsmG n=1 Tax=Salinibius halmophilus TaxID=1853216 RepID=UPI000E67040B|nr:16S rRNA (guanine(527)-N(7))-methyltransferase RsmG [Salinibius halmophilus]